MLTLDSLREEALFRIKGKPGEGLCCVRGCRNPKAPKKGPLCHKHAQQRWRHFHPKHAEFAALRDHARERRIPFTITYDYFLGMIDVTSFMDHEAEDRGEVLTWDRVDPADGYVPGNIQLVTHSLNVIKGNRERYLPEFVQSLLERKRQGARSKISGWADENGATEEALPLNDDPF